MSNKQLQIDEKFYHPDLNLLICCRDIHFNKCYDDETYTSHLKDYKRRYIIDNSGPFHTSYYKFKNDWKEFIVIDAKFDGGSSGHDPYPDAWVVYCSPIEDPNVIIKFHQLTHCYAHTIDEVNLIP